MNLEINGKLIDKGEIQQIKDTFRKREFVLELADDSGMGYTNYAKMQLVQQKCELLDRFNEGDNLRVSFNIKGNRYERDGKTSYFSNLDAWRVEHADGAAQQGGGGGQQQQQGNGGNQGGGNQGFNQNAGFNQNQGGGNQGNWSGNAGGNQGGYAGSGQGNNGGGNANSGGSDDLPF